MFRRPPRVIIPFGLKSWLLVVGRAVILEQPQNIVEFIASYSRELSDLRREHPWLNIQDLANLLKVRIGEEVTPALSEETPALSEETPALSEVTPALSEETPALSEVTPALSEETPALSEETPALSEETPALSVEEAMMSFPGTIQTVSGSDDSLAVDLPLHYGLSTGPALEDTTEYRKKVSEEHFTTVNTTAPETKADAGSEPNPANGLRTEGLERRPEHLHTDPRPVEIQRIREEPILPEEEKHGPLGGAQAAPDYVRHVHTSAPTAQATDVETLPLKVSTSPWIGDHAGLDSLAGSALQSPSPENRTDLSECQSGQTVTSPQSTVATKEDCLIGPNSGLLAEGEVDAGEESFSATGEENEALEKKNTHLVSPEMLPQVPGFLSLTFPIQVLCNAGSSSLTLRMRSTDGAAVYPPGAVPVVHPPEGVAEPGRSSWTSAPPTAANMEWSFKFCVETGQCADTEE